MVNKFAGAPILNCSSDTFAHVGESLLNESRRVDLGKEAEAARSFLQSQFNIGYPAIQRTLSGFFQTTDFFNKSDKTRHLQRTGGPHLRL